MEGYTLVPPASLPRPGQMKAVRTPSGRRLLINLNGAYHAVSPDCPHQGCALADGSLEGSSLTCICHFARFEVATGRVLGGPAEEPLRTYRVALSDGEVWVEG